MAGPPLPGDQASDAARWWRAYQLAEHDQADELRELAAAGDDHARWQLASWLSDRARLAEAVEVIRPLADAGDAVAELWLARWLADCDRVNDLRQRAGRGGYHASRLLARVLASHGMAGELRERASAGDYHALRALAGWLAKHDLSEELRDLVTGADARTRLLIFDAAGEGGSAGMNALRVLAGLGDVTSRRRLARRLAREGLLDELRRGAEGGDEYPGQWLDEAPGQ